MNTQEQDKLPFYKIKLEELQRACQSLVNAIAN